MVTTVAAVVIVVVLARKEPKAPGELLGTRQQAILMRMPLAVLLAMLLAVVSTVLLVVLVVVLLAVVLAVVPVLVPVVLARQRTAGLVGARIKDVFVLRVGRGAQDVLPL